jgi:hypothetical protein
MAVKNHSKVNNRYHSSGWNHGLIIGAIGWVSLLFMSILSSSATAKVVGGILLIVLGLFMWRVWNWTIITSASTIKIGNLFGSKTVLWTNIDHFEAKPVSGYPLGTWIFLKNGDSIVSLAISCAAMPSKKGKQGVINKIAELNELLARHQELVKHQGNLEMNKNTNV